MPVVVGVLEVPPILQERRGVWIGWPGVTEDNLRGLPDYMPQIDIE